MSCCLFAGPVFIDPTVAIARINELLPSNLNTLHVFYPGTANIPWGLYALSDRTTTLNFVLHCDNGAIAQYHSAKSNNPSGLAQLIGNPVPLTTNARTYRTMFSRFYRATGQYDIQGALNAFLVNWGSSTGRPGDFAGAQNQTLANQAQQLLQTEATTTSFSVFRDTYHTEIMARGPDDYVFIDISDPLSFGYNELAIWIPELTGTPCKWILRCNGESDVMSYFTTMQNITIETLSDNISTLIRNF